MKIKTKLTLSVGLLFILILLICTVSTIYINTLKTDSNNILTANYNSLQYTQNILSLLELSNDSSYIEIEKNIKAQENNISEVGEKEATQKLRMVFNNILNDKNNEVHLKTCKEVLFQIIDMNMKAIDRKSLIAKNTAEQAVFWIAIISTYCFITAFTLLINLPSNIANPIKELTHSIQEIAAKNYSKRVNFEGHNEFGQLADSFNVMARKLEEYDNSSLAKLMIEKKRIETLINNMNDPVIGLDESLKIVFINEVASKVIGLNSVQVTGLSAEDIASRNDLMRVLIQDLTVESNESGLKQPIRIYANHKESYFDKEILHINVTPTAEKEIKRIGYVILLKNITLYKELDAAKTNFIATVSHEFKTPIASIQMGLQLLENQQTGVLNQEQIQLVGSIKDDILRLLKITSELLDLTQVESGLINLKIKPFNIKEVIEEAVKMNVTESRNRNIQFQVNYPDCLPNVKIDFEKTIWAFSNIISNAIRYSYDYSAIYIDITLVNNYVKIAIKDTGLGIPPQYKDKIFDKYYRVPDTNKTGTGLGLAITKELLELQGGSISVDSDWGKGTTFYITLIPE